MIAVLSVSVSVSVSVSMSMVVLFWWCGVVWYGMYQTLVD